MMEMTEFRNGLSMDDMFYFNPSALFGCESALPNKTKLKERHVLFVCCSRLKNEEMKDERKKETKRRKKRSSRVQEKRRKKF